MMFGKSQPPQLILEIIKSNNFLSFSKEHGNGDEFIIVKILFFKNYFTFILIKRELLCKISLFISLTFKFALFTHHCNLRTKFYNEMY